MEFISQNQQPAKKEVLLEKFEIFDSKVNQLREFTFPNPNTDSQKVTY